MIKGDDAVALVAELIETFEDFLESKGIDIPNPDKAESEGPCLIYGDDYGNLSSDIEGVLTGWEVISMK